jgi:MSHA biogenesis protein MshQ
MRMVAASGLLAGCLAAPPASTDGVDDGAQYRRRITIAAGAVGAPLGDFPVLVRLAGDEGVRAHASEDGLDLVFRDGAGELLAFERRSWDPEVGDLLAWVKVPLVAADTATEVYLHYGGEPDGEDLSDPPAVWSNGFAAVWHLDEAVDEIVDSTASAVDALRSEGTPASIEGYIGRALELDGGSDFVSFGSEVPPEIDSGAALTATAWARYDQLGRWSHFVSKAPTDSNSFGWALGIDAGYDFLVRTMNGDLNARGWSDVAQPMTDVWYHWAMVFDGGQSDDAGRLRGFRDGVEHALVYDGPIPSSFDAQGGPLYIGCASWNPVDYCIAGAVDEVRVATVARSPAWLAAEHANQKEGSTFLAVGSEEILE